MSIVKLTSSYPAWPLHRQTPGGAGKWGDCTFAINHPAETCDAWVVVDDLKNAETTRCPGGRTIFVNIEPPCHITYHPGFLEQFDVVLTPGGFSLNHPGVREFFPPQPWYFGLDFSTVTPNTLAAKPTYLGYDEIAAARPKNSKLLSVVCSSKTHSPGHEQRLKFVTALKEHFKDRLDWFGAGVRPLVDKSLAVTDYKYHITIENSRLPHYWTEKIADTYLGWAMPLYCGCPNIADYFDPRAMVIIDVTNVAASVEAIENALSQNAWENSFEHIERARELVLERYNLFPVIANLVAELPAGPVQTKRIRPHSHFVGRVRTMLRRTRYKLQKGLGISRVVRFLARL